MSEEVSADIVIIGGGVAGSWLLNHFSRAGYQTLMFEKDRLGGVQTSASQGMIHGGIKYTLGGALTSASETIAGMPESWRRCIAGEMEPDLREVKILSDHYYLFSDASFSSRLTTFLGSKVVKGRVDQLKKQDYPPAFQSKAFGGKVYRLQDFVVDPKSLIDVLTRQYRDHIFNAQVTPVMAARGNLDFLKVSSLKVTRHKVAGTQAEAETKYGKKVRARLYIFAAGTGNEDFLIQTGRETVRTQRRPLHQVMIKAPSLPSVYAHAFALKSGSLPRITITTHKAEDGDDIWYLGGDLAETGVSRSESEQIKFSKKEIKSLLPWVDLEGAQWKTFKVDRAEPGTAQGQRPDQPVLIEDGNMIFCWPIKLTLTPLLAAEVMEKVSSIVTPSSCNPDLKVLDGLLPPAEADGPWEAFVEGKGSQIPCK